MEKNKENLFILSDKYNSLLREANSLIPEDSVIINTLYKEIIKRLEL